MIKDAIRSFLLVVALAATGSAQAVVFNGHDYQVVTLPTVSWAAAQAHVLATLGPNYHLATITTAAEDTFVGSLIVSGGEWWLGGEQGAGAAEPGGDWNWINGEGQFWNSGPVGAYSNWLAGEPNNVGVGEQHLAHVSGGWNDEGNLGNISGYIAESVPTPATVALMLAGLAALRLQRR